MSLISLRALCALCLSLLFEFMLARMKWIAFFLILLSASAPTPATCESRKLIEWGWDTPSLQEMPPLLPNAQALPFDGAVFDVDTPLHGVGLSWTLFGRQALEQQTLDALAAEYRNLEWGRMTDNFLRLTVFPADIDWFDEQAPGWDVIYENARLWSRLAHELGFVGVVLDVEQYGVVKVFDYAQQPNAAQKSFEEYAERSYQRGQAYMAALEAGFPGITVLFTYGLTIDLSPANPRRYELLIPFLEGMAFAAGEGTMLIDGYEHSYIYRDEAQFRQGREQIRAVTPQYPGTNSFRQPLLAAFGLWIDPVCGDGGLPPEGCGFTPTEFQQALGYALQYSDRYVWVYSQRINWYTNQNIPPQWWDVMNPFR